MKETVLWNAVVLDTATATFSLSPNDVPALLQIGGLGAGETVTVQRKPFEAASLATLRESAADKSLTVDNNNLLIEAPGNYQVTMSCTTQTAATIQAGVGGG